MSKSANKGGKKGGGGNGVLQICRSSRETGSCTKDVEAGSHVQRFIGRYSNYKQLQWWKLFGGRNKNKRKERKNENSPLQPARKRDAGGLQMSGLPLDSSSVTSGFSTIFFLIVAIQFSPGAAQTLSAVLTYNTVGTHQSAPWSGQLMSQSLPVISLCAHTLLDPLP